VTNGKGLAAPVVVEETVDRRVVRESCWIDGIGCKVDRPFSRSKDSLWCQSKADKAEYSANLRKAAREVRGLPEPAEIARIRKNFGLSQRRASELLTGSLHSFQKYEAGTANPSRGFAILLWLFDLYPKLIAQVPGYP
jgi:putative zinc finger/helix-turn-helix YgiT family protein